jgi:hypothetical protein
MEDVIVASRRATPDESAATIKLPPTCQNVAVRVRVAEDGGKYVLLINKDLNAAATVNVAVASKSQSYHVIDLVKGEDRGRLDAARPLRVSLAAGGGACLRL